MKQNRRFDPFNTIVGPTLAPHAPTLQSSLFRKFQNAFISFSGIPAYPKKRLPIVADRKLTKLKNFGDRVYETFLGPKEQFGMLDYATGMLDWGLLLARDFFSSVIERIKALSTGMKFAIFIPVTLPILVVSAALTIGQIALRTATYAASFAIVAATSIVTLAVHAVTSIVKNVLVKRANQLNIDTVGNSDNPGIQTTLGHHLQSKDANLLNDRSTTVVLDESKDKLADDASYKFIFQTIIPNNGSVEPEFKSLPIDYNNIKKPAKNDVDARAAAALVALDHNDIAKDMDALLRAPSRRG